MDMLHRIAGYDRRTELLASEHDIPAALWPAVRALVPVAPDDPHAVLSYPLEPPQVRDIAGLLGAPLDPDALDYALEPFAEPGPSERAFPAVRPVLPVG